ncbi:MAG: T9SS type A sorting domain-containing protein [Bacteroidota bacterium]
MKMLRIVIVLCLMNHLVNSQSDTLAMWTFPTGTQIDSLPDYANSGNLSKYIFTDGGTSVIDYSKNGVTSKSAQATGWDSGTDLKSWQIELNTTGYGTLFLKSLITSGGLNPGPRDWKLQYRRSTGGIWIDVPNGEFVAANNWTTGNLDSIPLPNECNDTSSVFIRWIMTSDTSHTGLLVLSEGISKIDNIIITGSITIGKQDVVFDASVRIYPNPVKDILYIKHNNPENGEYQVIITDISGKNIYNGAENEIDIRNYSKGIYFVKVITNNGINVQKVVVE